MNKTLLMFLTLILSTAILPVSVLCTSEIAKASEKKQAFRLLAVEATFDHTSMKSGQILIKSLLNYSNWNNETDQCVSYIHLLSRYTKDEVMSECAGYWRGNSTKANIRDEIVNFLGSASSGEVVVFFYCGHGKESALKPEENIYINSYELTQWLNAVPEAAHMCVIFDTSLGGSWINDGAGTPFGENKLVLCSSRSDQTSWGWADSWCWSWFTGQKTTQYRNGSILSLGIIGGFVAAKDLNKDGWMSFLENFAFAKPSTEQYSLQQSEYFEDEKYIQNPVSYNGLPNEYDPPLALVTIKDVAVTEIKPYSSILSNNSSTSINVTVENQGEETMTFNVTLYCHTIQIGNQTVTLISKESRTSTFNWTTPVEIGNYTITAEVSQVLGEIDTKDNVLVCNVTVVLLPGDTNDDEVVDIYDVVRVSLAFDSETGDPNWNPEVDITEPHGQIDIFDVVTVTMNFGKTV